MTSHRPFECPVPGCHKRGSYSSIKQHFRAVHRGVSMEDLERALTKKEKIMPVTFQKDQEPRRPSYKFVFTMIGAAVALAILGFAGACRFGLDSVCPLPSAEVETKAPPAR